MQHLSSTIICHWLFICGVFAQSFPDSTYLMPVSEKYQTSEGIIEKGVNKLVIDYNGIAYLHADKGLYRVYEDQIVQDGFYLSLADKKPIDITAQEQTGYLFYLYDSLYLTNAHAGKLYAHLPKAYQFIRVSADYKVLVYTLEGGAIYHNNSLLANIRIPAGLLEIYTYQNDFYALTDTKIFRLEHNDWKELFNSKSFQSIAFANHSIYLGTDEGMMEIDFQGNILSPLDKQLPVRDIKKLSYRKGQLWAITDKGAFLKDSLGCRYFASQRWLDNDRLIDIGFDNKEDVYLLSSTGLNKIAYKEMTLAKKATFFEDKIRKNHMRYGFVCSLNHSRTSPAGGPFVHDHDNDGLWTSFYLSSQALKYAVTGEEKAKRYAWESFEAFERLISVNPLKGFPSRTFERTGYKVSDVERWRQNSPDKGWEWKGTTSSDEFVAYILITAMMDEFVVKTEAERKRVVAFIDAILMHILENDYYFIDNDGKPTTWARWHPDFVNGYPETIYDRKLNSTLLIAGLQLGYALTKKEIYLRQLKKIMSEFGYLENMMRSMYTMKPTPHRYQEHLMGMDWNHSDDEMAFLTYWVLDRYALNKEMKQKIEWVIKDHWEIEKPERNALWNLIAFASTGEIDLPATIWHLREFPLDLINYPIKNSHRKDLTYLEPNFRNQTTKRLLPPGERPMHRHNSNPFNLDGGNGREELAGDEYLFPYWLGKYLGVIH